MYAACRLERPARQAPAAQSFQFFFALLAEGSLAWRREKLKEVEETKRFATLPETEHPTNEMQKGRMIVDWEGSLKAELTEWKDELDELKNRPIDKQLIFDRAKHKAMYLEERKNVLNRLN